MGMDDFLDKAKAEAEQHPAQTKEALEKAGDFIKSKTDDSGDQKVDEAVSQAEGYVDKQQ